MSVVTAVRAGYIVNFGEGGESFPNDLREVQPTFFLGVPRVWERLAAGVQFRVRNASRLKRWNYNVWQRRGAKIAAARMRGRRGSPVSRFLSWLFLGRSLRKKLGMSRIRVALSGAAPIAPDVLEYLWSLGIPVREVYGQTENTALATATPEDDVRIGKVGRPVPGAELRIADSGEVLVRSPGNFLGYLGDEAATQAAYDDGWLRTGDVGEIDADGFLRDHGSHEGHRHDRRRRQHLSEQSSRTCSRSRRSSVTRWSSAIGRPYLAALIGIDIGTVVGLGPAAEPPVHDAAGPRRKGPKCAGWWRARSSEVNRQARRSTSRSKGSGCSPSTSTETGELTATQKVAARARPRRSSRTSSRGCTRDDEVLLVAARTACALGAVYALVALGFVVIFRATGVINFAQGGLVVLRRVLVYQAQNTWHWFGGCDTWPGFIAGVLLAIVCVAAIGAAFESLVLRRMIGQPIFAIILITIGLFLLVEPITTTIWRNPPGGHRRHRGARTPCPSATSTSSRSTSSTVVLARGS